MNRKQINGLYLWQFESLEKEPEVRHFVSGRTVLAKPGRPNPGKTEGPGDSLNSTNTEHEFTLSYSSVPDREEVRLNRSKIASALEIPENRLYFPSQVHETRVANVNSSFSAEDLQDTDALITRERGVGIAVLAADCVPVLLYDKKNKAAGAVHSGWRGTVARILEKTLQEMRNSFGTRGEDLMACIGPSVCQDSYEVGGEVVSLFSEEYGAESGLMISLPDNRARLDLWKANKLQLLSFGVPEQQIETGGLCTIKNNQHFFSARKGDTGRFAAGIVLK